MPERREPPHDPVDERTALEDRLDYHRTTLLMKCGGLTPQELVQQAASRVAGKKDALTA
jgi:hypothetical protein